jgi:hypothetical protein
MILSWMLYSTLLALLLGVAAAMLETPIHQRGWPVRALWITATAGSFLIPVAGRFLSIAGVGMRGSAADGRMAFRPSAEQAGFDGLRSVRFPFDFPSPLELDALLIGMWITCSALAVVALMATHAAVLRRSKSWQLSELDGQEVWVSSESGPAVVGFVRPRIVVPRWLLARDRGERELVLLHEAEHIKAGDQRVLFVGLLALLALPWNVPLWWQWRRLRQAVELDCDRRVLAKGMAPLPYSRLLLEVTERGVAHRFVVAGLAESPLFLERRIRLMLPKTPAWGFLRSTTAALLASILVVASCSMDQPADPSSADVTLWIVPGAYHLGTRDSEPLSVGDLRGALQAALATSAAPSVLNVRAAGSTGFDFIMARRAACEAGVRRLEYDLDIPAGSSTSGDRERARGTEEIGPPCVTGGSQERDTAAVTGGPNPSSDR